MTDDQATRLPSGYRPRRALSVPMIAEHERPDPAELARLRKQSQRRWVPIARSR